MMEIPADWLGINDTMGDALGIEVYVGEVLGRSIDGLEEGVRWCACVKTTFLFA